MAKIQSTSSCIILFALIACQAILSTEGRQIKNSMNKKEATSAESLLNEGKREILPPISYMESAEADINGFRPTTPGNSPGVGHSRHTQDAAESKVDSASTGEHSIDDFRPTTPGHSPGIGHAFNKNDEPKA